jgi:hypothetical protein
MIGMLLQIHALPHNTWCLAAITSTTVVLLGTDIQVALDEARRRPHNDKKNWCIPHRTDEYKTNKEKDFAKEF